MFDTEEVKKFPVFIEVKPRRGYKYHGIAQNILSRMELLFIEMYKDYEPFRFRVEFCRYRKLKAYIFFKSKEDKEAYELDDRYQQLLADLARYSKPKKIIFSVWTRAA